MHYPDKMANDPDYSKKPLRDWLLRIRRKDLLLDWVKQSGESLMSLSCYSFTEESYIVVSV